MRTWQKIEDAQAVASKANDEPQDTWSYVVEQHDFGYFYIEIFDEDGDFVVCWGEDSTLNDDSPKARQQVNRARKLGRRGYGLGVRAPAQCSELLEMLAGRSMGDPPPGEAETVDILDAYISGFDEEASRAARAALA